MKGTVITDAVSTVSIMIILIILLFTLPNIIAQVKDMLVVESPKVASRDLAGLATITAASNNDIEINYSTEGDVKYDVEFRNRLVKVTYSDIELGTYEDSDSRMGVDINENLYDANSIVFKKVSGVIEVDGYEE